MQWETIFSLALIAFVLYRMKLIINKYPNLSVSLLLFFIGYWLGNLIDSHANTDAFKWLIAFALAWKGRLPAIRFFKRRRVITKAYQEKVRR
jgi:hypothetical protein